MQLSKGIPVLLGPIKGMVFGGPFRKYVEGTRRLIGVKMAAEIDHPHDISIPTEDFSVPDPYDMQVGLLRAVQAMAEGNDIYAGCMGGIGRTGLFMGCLAKVMKDYHLQEEGDSGEFSDPVAFVRHYYTPHAIETAEQQQFVRGFRTDEILNWVRSTTKPEVVVRQVETIKYVTEYPGLWEYITHWWGGSAK